MNRNSPVQEMFNLDAKRLKSNKGRFVIRLGAHFLQDLGGLPLRNSSRRLPQSLYPLSSFIEQNQKARIALK